MNLPDLTTVLATAGVIAIPLTAGRLTARLGGWAHACALAVILALSAGIGTGAYLQHASEVPPSRAQIGAAVAAVFAGLLPLLAYFEVGYWLRSRIALALIAISTAVPLLYYGFVAAFAVADLTNCTAGQYECPI